MVQGPTDVWPSPRPGHQHPEDVWRQVHRRPDGREEESQVWHEVSTGVWPMFKTLHAKCTCPCLSRSVIQICQECNR